jgi:phosphohistidine swiveling domain-containing protein
MTRTPLSSTASKALFLLSELPPDPEVVGSKAANLRDAANRGLRIPETAVIPASVYNELVPGDGLTPPEIRAHIHALDLEPLGRDLRAALEAQFGDIRFAVRSSSNMEDAADRSFAGQYESFLDVPLQGITDAVRGCWLSLWSDDALTYRGATAGRPSMAVIVQPFLRGRLGGVAFSADPVSGNPFQIVIDYVGGDASVVTDGTVGTQLVKLDLHDVVLRRAAEPFQSIAEACLAFDRPVDVEWTWDEARGLSLLQVRPITGVRRLTLPATTLGAYCLPIPEPFSRLGASLEFEKNAIYQTMVRRLSTPGFRSKMLVVYGRLYLFEEPGTPSKDRVAAGLFLSLAQALLYFSRRRAVQQPIAVDGTARASLLAAVQRYLAFYRTSSYAGYLYNSATGLLVRYLNTLTAGQYNRPLLYSLLACPRSVTVRRDNGLHALSQLLTRTDDAHWRARQTPAFTAAYERYCREFVYVFADRNPRDPHFEVDHALAYSLLAGRQHQDAAAGTAQWEREVFGAIRRKRFGSIRLAAFRMARVLYRNSVGLVKEDRNHIFYLASARLSEFIAREQAALCRELSLREIEDLYFMTLREIESGGSARLREFRRRVHMLSREFVNAAVAAETTAAVENAGSTLTGIPCSPGVVTGPVVFVRARQDFTKATPGSIIVTDNLRPFWTPVLASAAGLLCSTGNVLSHGASVAREHGVPAVLGLGEILFTLHEGEIVTVNGLTGQVLRQPRA